MLALFAIHQQTGKAIAYCTSSPNSNPNQEDDSSRGHSSFTSSISGNDKNFGAGQISSMDKTELEQLRPKIAAYMEGAVKEGEMLFFLLTNILTESSDLVFAGEGAKELVETAFGEPQENWVHVPGLVSRKKQFVPSVLHVLQQ